MSTSQSLDQPPLTTAAEVLARVTELIGTAITDGQLWLLFVDGDDRQAPVIVPISATPHHPEPRGMSALTRVLRGVAPGLATAAGPGGVIFVRERVGGAGALPLDQAWAEALIGACRDADLPLRGCYLSTSGGVVRLR